MMDYYYFINCFAKFWKTNASGVKGKNIDNSDLYTVYLQKNAQIIKMA